MPRTLHFPAKEKRPPGIHQFLIVLADTDPLIWRRIEVPEEYTFWDLHVAIQDAMGWHDTHLHEFQMVGPKKKGLERIGLPDEMRGGSQLGWECLLRDYFSPMSPVATYQYDFGDDWRHVVMHEGFWNAMPKVTYPRCIAGDRACPPEDCGGPPGFDNFLSIITNPEHPEFAETKAWARAKYDPAKFDPRKVKFTDPKKRWQMNFGH